MQAGTTCAEGKSVKTVEGTMTMDRDNVSTEQAIFTIDEAQARVESVADDLMQLVSNLRALLPEGSAADVTRPIEDLSQRIREAVAESRVERARGTIMDHGLPLDDVECASCGSADFSNDGCESCCSIRGDGLVLARRLAGWTV
jgi:hypothetical protein